MKRCRIPSFVFWGILLVLGGCNGGEMPVQQTDQLKEETEAARPAVAQLKPSLIHSVFFWLNEGVTEEEKAAFIEGCRKLGAIEPVLAAYIGPPSATPDREVVDHSFDVALIVHFADLASHDVYQEHPVHQEFIDKYSRLWKRVQVFDNDVTG